MCDSDRFPHIQNCIDDFDDARRVLRALSESDDGILRGAAFKYAVVAYCRAYTPSHGNKGSRRMKLDQRYIPERFRDLHDELVRCRDKMYAHTDRDILHAKLSPHEICGRKVPMRVRNVLDPLELVSRKEEMVKLIELTMDSIFDDHQWLLGGGE